MALNPVQITPRQPKKDAMDKVLQGLQIAEAAFKIPVNYQQYKAYAAEAGMKEDERAGITTRAKIGAGGGVVVPVDAAAGVSGLTPKRYGAPLMPMRVREGDEVKDVQVAMPEQDQKFFTREKELRSEYEGHQLTKETTASMLAAKKALEVLHRGGGGYRDIAAIKSFFKTVESNSAVNEGEFAAAAKANGLMDKVLNAKAMFENGDIITGPGGRKAMAKVIGEIMSAQLSVQDVLDDRYTDMANDQQFKANNVVTGFWAKDDSPLGAMTKPKQVEQGDWDGLSRIGKRKLMEKLGQ